MSTQEQLDLKQSQIEQYQRKYGTSSPSPDNPESTSRNQGSRRVKSGSLKQFSFKVNQSNFIKNAKATQGGGFYKRSQIMGSSFPQIKSTARLGTDNSKMKKQQDDSYHLSSLETMNFMRQTLGPDHHCHFETQVKVLLAKLEISDALAQRAKDELDNVIWMVKNYNNEGLISRLLTLQQLKNDLEQAGVQMRQEIEVLGLQRDDWFMKYQEINEKLLKMQGIEKDLIEAKHKLDMSTESIEMINKRLREKQLEVQDWQRKCNTHDEQYKRRINSLEDSLKTAEQEKQGNLKKILKMENENILIGNELKSVKEKLDEEQRRSKQLHAELLDTRVNKVQNLQDEIQKQKKVIQQRVDEIEEQEKKIRQLNNKITLLETQLKNFDDVAKSEKEELERSWQKKYKELERQSIQYKRDLNQLEIQLQQNDLLTQQKEQEVEQAVQKIKELNNDLDQVNKFNQDLKLENQKQKQELEELEYELQQIEEQNKENEDMKNQLEQQILQLNQEINRLQVQEGQLKKENEQYKQQKEDVEKVLDKVKDQLNVSNEQNNNLSKQLQLEQDKNYDLNKQKNELNQQIEQFKEDQLKHKQLFSHEIEQKNQEITRLQKKITEFEDQDKDFAEKINSLQTTIDQKDDQIKQLIEENKNQQIQISDKTQLNNELQVTLSKQQVDIEKLNQQIQVIKEDKTQEKLLQEQVDQLKEELSKYSQDTQQQYELMLNEKEQFNQENIQLRQRLEQLQNDYDTLLDKYNKLLEEYGQQQERTQREFEHSSQQYQSTIDQQTHQINVLEKKCQKLNDQLEEQLDKVELLEQALQQKGDIKMPLKQEKRELQRSDTFQQIFIEGLKEDEMTLKFSEIKFNKKQGHLSLCYWIKIDKVKSKDQMPIVRIISEGKKLLEMGIWLETKNVYCTYIPNNHPQNTKKSSPITVTSQLSIKLGQYQLLTLVLNESGKQMDMGLAINGARDDQVSISSTLIIPQAELTFGKFSNYNYSLKDAILLTQEITSINIFKEVYRTFYKKHNNIIDNTNQRQYYFSSGELIQYLLQQLEYPRNNKSRSPQEIRINNRIVPAGLVNQFDLLQRTQRSPKQGEENIEEEQVEEIWSRKLAIDKLKKFLFQNFQFKGLLKPFIDNYDYLAIGMQYLQPARENDGHKPTRFHKPIKANHKISNFPYYVISFKQFLNYLAYVGILRISTEELKQILNEMGILYQIGKIEYLHYDHFLIILRECIMNRAELLKKKADERGTPDIDDLEAELDVIQLPNLPDNWNLGKFYININRCHDCDKHQQTTRHTEQDFIKQFEYVSGVLKELFPNVEIIENEEKSTRLESFEVYVKNAIGNTKIILLQKQESMTKFMENIDKKLLDLIIGARIRKYYELQQQMNQETNIHNCKKFKKFDFQPSVTDALVYMKLIEAKCPRDDALKFSKKRICRFDASQECYGPTKCKIIKNATQSRGWVYPETVRFDLGKEYDRPQLEEDQAFQKFFKQNKDKMIEQQSKALKVTQAFVDDINSKFNLQYHNKNELKEKIKDIRQKQETYRNSAVDYLKYKGQRYIELVEQYNKEQKEQQIGFESIFPKNMRIKQKKNEEFYVKIHKQEQLNLQRKFIKLQNQGELIVRLSKQEGIKEGEGLELEQYLNSHNEINEVKDLALQFNKSQYVFSDETSNKQSSQHQQIPTSLKLIRGNQRKNKEMTFEQKLEQMVSTRMETMTSNQIQLENLNFDSLLQLQKNTQTLRDKEQRKLREIVTNRRVKCKTSILK